MHISHTKSFNIPVSITLATLAYMINVYEICLNTTNYPIFNMQDFRYCPWTSILDCFGQLISPPCNMTSGVTGQQSNLDRHQSYVISKWEILAASRTLLGLHHRVGVVVYIPEAFHDRNIQYAVIFFGLGARLSLNLLPACIFHRLTGESCHIS